MKFLLLIIGLFAAYCIFKAFKRRIQRGRSRPPGAKAEDMVRCAQCGVHLPRSESLGSASAFYCSAEHRRLREPAD